MPHIEHKGWPSASQLKELFPKPSIDMWIQSVGKEKAKSLLVASQEYGNHIHEVIGNFLTGVDSKVAEGEFDSRLLNSIDKFLIENSLTVTFVEKHMSTETLRIHGTPDLICSDLSGDLVIVDWKTGGLLDGLAFLQLVIYSYIVRDITKGQCKIGYLCKIEKDSGKVIPIRVENLDKWDWLVEGLAHKWWDERKIGQADAKEEGEL